MKVIAVGLLALVALGAALPSEQYEVDVARNGRNIISDLIAGMIERVAQQIREAGFDPYTHDGINIEYALPVPALFNCKGHVHDLSVAGVSNIVIEDIHFSTLRFRLTLDITLPEVAVQIGDAGFDVNIFGYRFHGSGLGRLAVTKINVSGNIVLNPTLQSVRRSELELDVGDIVFNGYVNLMGINLTDFINHIVQTTVPKLMNDMRNEINEMVNHVAAQLITDILKDLNPLG